MIFINFIDLFSGIGGFRLALERAGHTCVAFCEIDKFARQTYKANFNVKNEIEWHDITTITNKEIEDFEKKNKIQILCGGFPCQTFSIAGKRRGFNEKRGTMFFEIMRFARILKPKYLLLENVKGLLNHENGKSFQIILSTLDELGYDAEWQLLNSKNFGVPQNRERVFIIGHLRGECTRQIFPLNSASGTNTNCIKPLIKNVSQGYRMYKVNGLSVALSSEGGGLGAKTGLYDTSFIDLTEGKMTITNNARCLTARYNAGITKRIGERSGVVCKAVITPNRLNKRQNGRRFKDVGEPMFTLTAQDKHGVAFNNKDNIKIRRLTPLECFRLQGFPDSFYYKAKEIGVSDSQLYKQAGNSVTVNVVYAIAKNFFKQLSYSFVR